MATTASGVAQAGPVRLSLGYKVIWGLAALGTFLISGTYGALLPVSYQDYQARVQDRVLTLHAKKHEELAQ
jgi:hypothetical protein